VLVLPDGVEARIRFVKLAPLVFFLLLLGGGMFSSRGFSRGNEKSLLGSVVGWHMMRTVVPNGLSMHTYRSCGCIIYLHFVTYCAEGGRVESVQFLCSDPEFLTNTLGIRELRKHLKGVSWVRIAYLTNVAFRFELPLRITKKDSLSVFCNAELFSPLRLVIK